MGLHMMDELLSMSQCWKCYLMFPQYIHNATKNSR
jgi:hypothetical protein